MVLGNITGNVTNTAGSIVKEVLDTTNLTPEIAQSMNTLITILEAIGIVFIVYMVFIIARTILNLIEKRRIKEIHKKVYEMDVKLDKILDKAKKGKAK